MLCTPPPPIRNVRSTSSTAAVRFTQIAALADGGAYELKWTKAPFGPHLLGLPFFG